MVSTCAAVSPRHIPLVRRVDVAIVGGTLAAVAAALAAAEKGSRVFLAAPRLYLGEDLCATLRLWSDEQANEPCSLRHAIFRSQSITTPLRVKKTLSDRLLEAGVEFVLGCQPVGLLETENCAPAGFVLANRAGRQAIAAKITIDATLHGLLMKQTPDRTQPVSSLVRMTRVVLGGSDSGSGLHPVREITSGIETDGTPLSYHLYEIDFPGGEINLSAGMEREQAARDRTWRKNQWRASEILFPTSGRGVLETDRLLALGPTTSETDGTETGRRAATQAKDLPEPGKLHVRVSAGENAEPGEFGEKLAGFRPMDRPMDMVPAGPDSLPMVAHADVLVIGGGTAGAAAAIGAAREGARVLVIEFQEGLGGVGTVGLIGAPYHGRHVGFAAEVPFLEEKNISPETKMEWLRREIRKCGGQIWCCSLAYGVWKKSGVVRGVVAATPYGHGLVTGQVVVDATGNADMAAVAGARVRFGADDENDIAIQGTGFALRPPGRNMVNSDFLLVDDSDVVDITTAVAGVHHALDPDAAYDTLSFLQSRERQRIVADHELSYLDQLLQRTYPDSVVLSKSDFDLHGYPSLPFFALLPHTEETRRQNHPAPACPSYTPYRCFLPRGVEGMLVAGLGIGMHRDAAAMMRMQKDLLNQGYAIGLAAAMSSVRNKLPRGLDVRALQKQLVSLNILPEQVLTDEDSFPLTDEQMEQATLHVADPNHSYLERSRALAAIFRRSDAARSKLRENFQSANLSQEARLDYARLLGFLEIPDGVPLLVEALDRSEFDDKILQGRMAEFAHLPTPVDSLILALGYSHDPRTIDPILRKLDKLDAGVTLSHHRAVALALESLANSRAAEPIVALLAKPGMRGHAMRTIEPLYDRPVERRRREGALREIVLARALYRCGDFAGIGQAILQEYADDRRSVLARHARMILAKSS